MLPGWILGLALALAAPVTCETGAGETVTLQRPDEAVPLGFTGDCASWLEVDGGRVVQVDPSGAPVAEHPTGLSGVDASAVGWTGRYLLLQRAGSPTTTAVRVDLADGSSVALPAWTELRKPTQPWPTHRPDVWVPPGDWRSLSADGVLVAIDRRKWSDEPVKHAVIDLRTGKVVPGAWGRSWLATAELAPQAGRPGWAGTERGALAGVEVARLDGWVVHDVVDTGDGVRVLAADEGRRVVLVDGEVQRSLGSCRPTGAHLTASGEHWLGWTEKGALCGGTRTGEALQLPKARGVRWARLSEDGKTVSWLTDEGMLEQELPAAGEPRPAAGELLSPGCAHEVSLPLKGDRVVGDGSLGRFTFHDDDGDPELPGTAPIGTLHDERIAWLGLSADGEGFVGVVAGSVRRWDGEALRQLGARALREAHQADPTVQATLAAREKQAAREALAEERRQTSAAEREERFARARATKPEGTQLGQTWGFEALFERGDLSAHGRAVVGWVAVELADDDDDTRLIVETHGWAEESPVFAFNSTSQRANAIRRELGLYGLRDRVVTVPLGHGFPSPQHPAGRVVLRVSGEGDAAANEARASQTCAVVRHVLGEADSHFAALRSDEVWEARPTEDIPVHRRYEPTNPSGVEIPGARMQVHYHEVVDRFGVITHPKKWTARYGFERTGSLDVATKQQADLAAQVTGCLGYARTSRSGVHYIHEPDDPPPTIGTPQGPHVTVGIARYIRSAEGVWLPFGTVDRFQPGDEVEVVLTFVSPAP